METIKVLIRTILPEHIYFALRDLLRPTRSRFLEILPKHSIGTEIGVFKGKWTKHILRVVKPRKLHLIDGWWKIQGDYFTKISPATNFGALKTRDAYNEAVKAVTDYDKDRVSEFHVEDDLTCLKKFNDKYFDWAYLDTSHTYEHTKKELEILKDKVKDGGMITGHDWLHHGVSEAVKEFCEKHDWRVIKQDNFTQWCVKKEP